MNVLNVKNTKPHSPPLSPPTPNLGLDLRSLGLFRVGLALVILYDLWDRARDLSAHYTGEGILPLEPFKAYFAESYFWSLNFLNDSFWFQALIFGLTALAALALLAGYRTRWANLICWVLLCSIQMRNPLVLQFGDVVLRLWLFWGLLLPLNACFSMDRQRAGNDPHLAWKGGAAVAFLLQLAFIYWFTAALKSGPDWWSDGTAVYYALKFETLAKPLGLYLVGFPGLLRFMTYLTLIVEILAPLLIFFPRVNGPLRTLAVFAMIGFHLALAMTLHLGIFPAACMVGWLAVLPAWFWNRLPATDGRLPWRLPEKGVKTFQLSVAPKPWASALALFLIAYLFFWNLRTVRFEWVASWFPYRANLLGEILRLEQRWGMYAPQPSKTGGWYVIPATLSNGERVDMNRNGDTLNWDKPANVAKTFKNDRWGNYLTRLWEDGFANYRPRYIEFLKERYRKRHPRGPDLMELELVQMRQVTEPFPREASLSKVVLYPEPLSDNRD